MEEKNNLGFSAYINELPREKKTNLINQIANDCVVSIFSVYRWINGQTSPSAKKKEIIRSIINHPISFDDEN